MRAFKIAAVVALGLGLGAPALTQAQPAETPAPVAAILPDAPVPYRELLPRTRPRTRTRAVPAPAPAPGPKAEAQPAAPVGPPGARLAPDQPLPPAELAAFVDGVVAEAMVRDHVAGVTVAVVQNGQVVLKKGYGFASLNPNRAVNPDRTLFRLGSISKTFTWITLMKEVEAGRIRLNQPVNLYLPEKLQVRDQGFDKPVRVIDLMQHAAGFEDRALGQLVERNFNRVRPLDLYLRQERPRRVHPAGAVATYSNYGAALAGEAATYSAGKPFERLAEDTIFAPLGLRRTTFREPHPLKTGLPAPMSPTLAADVAEGYRWTGVGFETRSFEFIEQAAPAGSASSTAADMARYMLLQLNGGQLDGVTIYNAATAKAFRTPLRQTPAGINGWAHGFMIYDLPGGWRGYGHDGGTLSSRTTMVVIPQLNLGVFVAANSESSADLVTGLPQRIVRAFYAPPQPYPTAGNSDLRPGTFTGEYLTSRRAFTGLEGFINLLGGVTRVEAAPAGRLATVTRAGTKVWSPAGDPRQGRFVSLRGDERLIFTMAKGRPAGFRLSDGGAYFQPMPAWKSPVALGVMAALTALAALATLTGLAARNRRERRENQTQTRASLVQNIQAVLWLAAMGLFGLWSLKSGDLAHLMFKWPGPLLVTASACALVAAGLTITTIVAAPAVWRGGRRVESWTMGRKAAFTLTVLIYAAFSLQLARCGALSPWSG